MKSVVICVIFSSPQQCVEARLLEITVRGERLLVMGGFPVGKRDNVPGVEKDITHLAFGLRTGAPRTFLSSLTGSLNQRLA